MLKKGKNPLFLFNGEALPSNPSIGYLEENEQLVEGTRNVRGQTIAQPVNRRINKFSNLVFPFLSLEDYNWLKEKVANFEVLLTYFDSEEMDVIVRRFYFGNLHGTPNKWENYQSVQKPTEYKGVKVDIIDMGY
jgi:hypothetical protein